MSACFVIRDRLRPRFRGDGGLAGRFAGRGPVAPDDDGQTRLDHPPVLARVVVPDAHHLLDPPHALGRPHLVNDGLDAVDHPLADDRSGKGIARLHGAGRQARQGRSRVVRVHAGQRPAVPGV